MAEPVEAAVEPVVEKTAPVIDPNVPLNRQIDRMLEATPEKEADKDDKTDDEDKDPKEDDKAEEAEKEPETTADEDDEDDTQTLPLEDLPPLAKYIMERLPAIEVVGHTPGKADKVYNVKRLQDLPRDFEFSGGKMAEMQFMAAHNANELNARQLQGQYQQEEQTRQYDAYKTQEAKDIQSDLKQLQKEGMLAKFKYGENDARFNDDPAVKEANEIHALMEKTNNSYINRKVNYRISYRDAADKYYAQQARTNKTEDKPKESPEDKERERNTHKVATRSGAPADTPKRMPAGSTTRDVLRLYQDGRI